MECGAFSLRASATSAFVPLDWCVPVAPTLHISFGLERLKVFEWRQNGIYQLAYVHTEGSLEADSDIQPIPVSPWGKLQPTRAAAAGRRL
jgi:hypothetical protein